MNGRVAILSSVHPPFDGRIFQKEARSLARAGYNVTLIVPHTRSEVVDGVSIQAIRRPESRVDRMKTTVRQVYAAAVAARADVYHLHDPELLPVGLMLRRLGKRVIYDIHEDVPRDLRTKTYVPGAVRWPLSVVMAGLETVAAKVFSALFPATPTIAARFVRHNPRTVVIHNYPLLDDFVAGARTQPTHSKNAAYVGQISVDRGLFEMVDALDRLPDVRLVLAGPFSPPSLRQSVATRTGWKQVDDRGVVDRGEVAAILQQSFAGIVTLHPLPTFVSSLPIKLFEYMAAGLPVVASDFPLWRELVDGAGVLVDPTGVDQIAAALRSLLDQPERAFALGQEGRRRVETVYNWRPEEQKLLDTYRDLLASAA